MNKKKKTYEKRIDDLIAMMKVQNMKGNWNSNEYMRGLANGLILAVWTMTEKEEPKLQDAFYGGKKK